MKIGLSSAVFYPDLLTEEAIGTISGLGFKCSELFLNSPYEYEESFVNRLVYEKEKYNMEINSVHAFSSSFEPYLFDAYERRRKDMFKLFKKVCKAAGKLGAVCYTFHGPRLQDINAINKKLIIDIYNKLIYTALENNIVLAQENVSWCISSKLDFISLIKEKCDSNLFFTMDIKQAYRAGINPLDYIDIMGDKLINFHINDRDEKHSCLLPLDGKVDYSKIFHELQGIKYKGNIIIEVYRENFSCYEELRDCKKKLEAFLK